MRNRDDFPKAVIRTLAERANQRCSNPGCGRVTSGPHLKSNKSIIVGVAAHICAAAPGGKRYDPDMTPEQRSSIDNGIWLCSTCAKLIDSDDSKYTPEFLRKWKKDHENSVSKQLVSPGLVEREFVEAVPQLSIQKPSVQSELKVEAKKDSEYYKITAADLVRAGFRPDRVHTILSTQDEALRKQNYRLAEFLNRYVDARWNDVPRTWRALIAGLPIVGQDVGSQSLIDLAKLAEELHPYLSKELRRIYYKRLPQIIIGILAEIQSFLQDAAAVGGLPLAVTAGAPASWKDWVPWLMERERRFKVDDSLLHGNWVYIFPVEVMKYNIDISKTWAGFLYDIISRLPNPDKQKGQLLRKYDFMILVYIWCATAPQDFKPALKDIIRRPVNSSDHTLAGIYKLWAENTDGSAD
jgi:hypothetical protein